MKQLFKTRMSKKSSGARWFVKPLDNEGHYDIQLVLPRDISDMNYSPFRNRIFEEGLIELEAQGHTIIFDVLREGLVFSLEEQRYIEVVV